MTRELLREQRIIGAPTQSAMTTHESSSAVWRLDQTTTILEAHIPHLRLSRRVLRKQFAGNRVRSVCSARLKQEPQLWRFINCSKLAIENNAHEHALCSPMIKSKISFSSNSEESARRFADFLSAHLTLELQLRPSLPRLESLFRGHAPSLFPLLTWLNLKGS